MSDDAKIEAAERALWADVQTAWCASRRCPQWGWDDFRQAIKDALVRAGAQ